MNNNERAESLKALSIPATAVNRFHTVAVLDEGSVRIAFGEGMQVDAAEVSVVEYRVAVLMSVNNTRVLHHLLSEMLKEIDKQVGAAIAPTPATAKLN